MAASTFDPLLPPPAEPLALGGLTPVSHPATATIPRHNHLAYDTDGTAGYSKDGNSSNVTQPGRRRTVVIGVMQLTAADIHARRRVCGAPRQHGITSVLALTPS